MLEGPADQDHQKHLPIATEVAVMIFWTTQFAAKGIEGELKAFGREIVPSRTEGGHPTRRIWV